MQKKLFFFLALNVITFFLFSQNVGIGTSFPTSKLDVKGNGATAATSSLNVSNSTPSSLLFVEDDGKVGINTSTPITGLHLISDEGLLATGTFGGGTALNLGAGTRMHFYPQKAAFRAGSVNGMQWNDVNIGNNSTAMGRNTTASGQHSTAMGHSTTASGAISTATGDATTASGLLSTSMGGFTTASGVVSTSMGYHTTASGYYSTAMGYYTTASGYYSTAMGNNTTASHYSTAIGLQTTASGDYSTAMGRNTTASGPSSTAMGENTTASGSYSTAMGNNTTASGYYSTAMGYGTTAESYVETAIGSFNTPATNPTSAGLVLTDRLFTIGNGMSPVTKSDALIILKNGNTTHNGNVTVNGTLCSTSGTVCVSDIRYKQNILPISAVSGSALANLCAINGYCYDFRVKEFPEKKFTKERQIGFIAQEVEKVYPELVTTDENGYKGVDYAKITPILVEAIKELKAENEALKAELTDKISKLENEIYGRTR